MSTLVCAACETPVEATGEHATAASTTCYTVACPTCDHDGTVVEDPRTDTLLCASQGFYWTLDADTDPNGGVSA